MATLADLTWDTLELLYGIPQFERPVEDTIVQGDNAGGTEFEFGNPDLWKRGDYVEMVVSERLDPATQVELSVLTEDHPAAGNTVTVRRNVVYEGQAAINWTTPATTSYVRKNPLFPLLGVYQAVQQVLENELWPHVWTHATRKITNPTPSTDRLYNLVGGDEDVVRVYQYNINAIERVQDLPFGWWDYEPRLHADALTVPGIVIRRVLDEAQPVYAVVRNRPDTGTVANISTQIEQMIPYMAAAKAMIGRISGVDYDPSRQERGQYNDRSYARNHYQTFAAEFLRMRDAERDRLNKVEQTIGAPKKYRGHPLRVRRLTG